jgi:glycosyltransferase involved in cell wall biosynthesis
MRVALYVHCFYPDHFYGTETYTLDLATNLREMGHEVVIVSAVFPGESKRAAFITRYEYQGLEVYCLDKNYFPHSIRETYYQESLLDTHKSLLSEIKPDLVHVTHLFNHTASLLDALKTLGIPSITTLTDFYGVCFNHRLEAANGSSCAGPNRDRSNCLTCYVKAKTVTERQGILAKLMGKFPSILDFLAKSLRIAVHMPYFRHSKIAGAVKAIEDRPDVLAQHYLSFHAAVAPTRFLKNAYEANGFAVPLHVMHFGVDVPRHPKPASRLRAIRFGYIGQIAQHKGVDILTQAFAALPAASAELFIYGSESQKFGYLPALKKVITPNPVYFKGTFPKDRLAEVLQELDCLVIPSRWHENSPLVLLNSLATHTPVIVSDVEGMTEFVENGRNGFIFRRDSVDELYEIMLRLTSEPQILQHLSKHAEYPRTTREMTEDMVSLYERVLSQ